MTTWRDVPPDAPEPPPGSIVIVAPTDSGTVRLLRDPDDQQERWRTLDDDLPRWFRWPQVWELAGRGIVAELVVPRPAPEPSSLAPVAAIVGPDDVLVLDLGPQASAQQLNTAIDAIKRQRPDLTDNGRVLVCAGIAGMAVIQGAAPPRVRDADDRQAIIDTMAEAVAAGDMEITGHDDNGDPVYRLTAQGIARVKAMGTSDQAGGNGG